VRRQHTCPTRPASSPTSADESSAANRASTCRSSARARRAPCSLAVSFCSLFADRPRGLQDGQTPSGAVAPVCTGTRSGSAGGGAAGRVPQVVARRRRGRTRGPPTRPRAALCATHEPPCAARHLRPPPARGAALRPPRPCPRRRGSSRPARRARARRPCAPACSCARAPAPPPRPPSPPPCARRPHGVGARLRGRPARVGRGAVLGCKTCARESRRAPRRRRRPRSAHVPRS
jgi:hypothetical protein